VPATTTTDYHGLSSMLRKILQLTQTAKQNVPYAYRIAVKTVPQPLRRRMYDYCLEKTIDPVTSVRRIFETIYENNLWSSVESRSGYGSELAGTSIVRRGLQSWLERHRNEISTFLDAPCGDFNWMRAVTFPDGIRYIGGEIVGSLVEEVIKKYQNDQRSFMELDIIEGALPGADAWLCRDVLFHFPFSAGTTVVEKFRQSRCKYFLSTSFPSADNAVDIKFGRFRPVNLTIAPFNLGEPLEVIPDPAKGGADRLLGVWKNPNLRN
jgi:hypothetical protein